MKKSEYDCMEKKMGSEIKLYVEFPKRTESNNAEIIREVREILSGVLREKLRETSENE